MNTDELFQSSAKRQAETTERQQQTALNQKADQQAQAKAADANAAAIDSRLRTGLDHLVAQEYPAAKRNGYDIQHAFQFSRVPAIAAAQRYTNLDLYMSKGGVVDMAGGNPPYRADYQLSLRGDEASGAIAASFRSDVTNQSEQLGTFSSATELSDPQLSDVFKSFIERSLQCEEQRATAGR